MNEFKDPWEWMYWMGFVDLEDYVVNADNTITILDDALFSKSLERLPFKIKEVCGNLTFGQYTTALNSFENFPDVVEGCLDCSNLTAFTTTQGVTPKMAACYIPYYPNIPIWEYRYMLFIDCPAIDIIGGTTSRGISARIDDILCSGRENGIMARGLIPVKMKQLKELAAEYGK